MEALHDKYTMPGVSLVERFVSIFKSNVPVLMRVYGEFLRQPLIFLSSEHIQMAHSLQIKPADSEQKADEQRKLFVGMIPKTMTDDQVRHQRYSFFIFFSYFSLFLHASIPPFLYHSISIRGLCFLFYVYLYCNNILSSCAASSNVLFLWGRGRRGYFAVQRC